ncbi:hypothetical protein EPH95_01815 [Salicibibacter halophilus]|uniref:Uncharacterized protein n=1 Tax=Salicibibacter halophilus TaxID=2502791 RepID=A0A514LES5_9BACI|nr:hypothetical protein [Salicibibacter halophilus]QDI90065.1 hypothetical protein EPH95_01815 [Salicibibacter halophilus]
MNVRSFMKVKRHRRYPIVETFSKEITKSPWQQFKEDSVKEIVIRVNREQGTQAQHLQVIHDYLCECRPFLSVAHINELGNHLLKMFGLK